MSYTLNKTGAQIDAILTRASAGGAIDLAITAEESRALAAEALLAPLASPALTGTPTAPTQTSGDNSTKLATTAYADAAASTASSSKADLVAGAIAGHLAGLNGSGNLTDSGVVAANVATKSDVARVTPTKTAANDPDNSAFSVDITNALAGEAKPKLYGKSVAINQLVGNTNARSVSVATYIGGNKWTFSGTPSSGGNTWLDFFPVQSGHVVFVYGGNSQVLLYAQGFAETNEQIFTMGAGIGGDLYVGVRFNTSTTYNTSCYVNVIDLTAIFTAAELTAIGTSVANLKAAWLKKFGYPLPQYIPYNAGSIVSNNATYQMRGRNLWDEVWEVGGISAADGQNTVNASGKRSVNYVEIAPSGSYYFHCPNAVSANRVAFYDANKAYSADTVLRWQSFSNGGVIVAPADAKYMRFYFTDYDPTGKVCVNISDASFNGQYEAYYNGGSVTADALNGIGTAMDSQDAEGAITRRIGSVDLGTLDYTYDATYHRFLSSVISPTMKAASVRTLDFLCGLYQTTKVSSVADVPDKSVYNEGNASRIYIHDSSYTDAAAFKAALSGVMLYYELATPTTDSTTAASLATQAGYNSLDPVSGDVQSADASLTYDLDIVTYIDEQVAALTAIISNL